MKYYIATKLDNTIAHNNLRDRLNAEGHTCTYDWTEHGPVFMKGETIVREVMNKEINGIKSADFVVVLIPGGRGTHIEMGIALSFEKKVFIITDRDDDHFLGPDSCCFYYHEYVERLYDVEELLLRLKV